MGEGGRCDGYSGGHMQHVTGGGRGVAAVGPPGRPPGPPPALARRLALVQLGFFCLWFWLLLQPTWSVAIANQEDAHFPGPVLLWPSPLWPPPPRSRPADSQGPALGGGVGRGAWAHTCHTSANPHIHSVGPPFLTPYGLFLLTPGSALPCPRKSRTCTHLP